jgi:hypothetical protein
VSQSTNATDEVSPRCIAACKSLIEDSIGVNEGAAELSGIEAIERTKSVAISLGCIGRAFAMSDEVSLNG